MTNFNERLFNVCSFLTKKEEYININNIKIIKSCIDCVFFLFINTEEKQIDIGNVSYNRYRCDFSNYIKNSINIKANKLIIKELENIVISTEKKIEKEIREKLIKADKEKIKLSQKIIKLLSRQ